MKNWSDKLSDDVSRTVHSISLQKKRYFNTGPIVIVIPGLDNRQANI